MIELIPIEQTPEENRELMFDPLCREAIVATTEYYKIIGFVRPWIGYIAMRNGQAVGSAGYKGAPINNRIEIAYGTFPEFQKRGTGTEICRQLVALATKTDPGLVITARTLQDGTASMAILRKNGFELLGVVYDKDDGDVYEWKYTGQTAATT